MPTTNTIDFDDVREVIAGLRTEQAKSRAALDQLSALVDEVLAEAKNAR